ncbi:MAG: CDP-glycerol glycerophosphotransferase family protein [Bacillus sp. (in: Bacteria)]|nr:CDP-glycerol glycerophosphotransferase family protein [Bacillus sp. (in: firmicutes)]
MFSYYGSQYGCNPKYITEYILSHYSQDKFDIVWAFNDPESKKTITGFRKVKTMSLKYFYELWTSKIIITNFRTTDLFVKRKNQYYIQTWHSSLRLKQIEKDAEVTLPKQYVEMAKKDSQKCDLLLSGCKFSTTIFKRAFWFEGEILEYGTPRNDIFFKDHSVKRQKIFTELTIPTNYKIILYAPTFRKDKNLDVYKLNYDEILGSLEKKFGSKWIFLVKLHPHMISETNQFVYGDNVLDVTSYDDIQELLNITDVLISDYSSLMFDFAITKRPCFLYVPDLDEYIKNERNLYFDVLELPFISATSKIDLLEKINEFSYDEYNDRLREFLTGIETFEDGNASQKLLDHINEVCFGKKRSRSEVYETI